MVSLGQIVKMQVNGGNVKPASAVKPTFIYPVHGPYDSDGEKIYIAEREEGIEVFD